MLKDFLARIGPEQKAQLPTKDSLWFDRAVVRIHGGMHQAPQLTFQVMNRAYGLNANETVPLKPAGGWKALFLGQE